jgi:hypothetical protein
MLTPEQIKQIIEFIIGALPGKQEEKQNLAVKAELWMTLTADLPFEAVRAAVITWAAENKDPWFPMPGTIREIALRLLNKGNEIPTPEDAWAEVMKQLTRAGRSMKPEFSHPLIKQAVNAIGWLRLCDSEMIGVECGHFMRIYATYRERAVRDLQDQQLRILGSKIKELETRGEVRLLNG